MPEGYFSCERDNEIIADGGFWCEACIVGKPAGEQSPDPRYCQGCFDVLKREADLITTGREKKYLPAWVPRNVSTQPAAVPARTSAISKLPTGENGENVPLAVLKHPGGRPRKVEDISPTTAWRRKKESQGALLL